MRSLFPSTSFISIGFPLLPHPRHLFQTCIPYQFPLPHPDTFANHSSSTTNPSLSLRYLSHTRNLFMNPSVLSYHPFLSPSLALPHPAISSFLTVPSFPHPCHVSASCECHVGAESFKVRTETTQKLNLPQGCTVPRPHELITHTLPTTASTTAIRLT